MIDTSLAGIHAGEDSEKRNPEVLYVICDEKSYKMLTKEISSVVYMSIIMTFPNIDFWVCSVSIIL